MPHASPCLTLTLPHASEPTGVFEEPSGGCWLRLIKGSWQAFRVHHRRTSQQVYECGWTAWERGHPFPASARGGLCPAFDWLSGAGGTLALPGVVAAGRMVSDLSIGGARCSALDAVVCAAGAASEKRRSGLGRQRPLLQLKSRSFRSRWRALFGPRQGQRWRGGCARQSLWHTGQQRRAVARPIKRRTLSGLVRAWTVGCGPCRTVSNAAQSGRVDAQSSAWKTNRRARNLRSLHKRRWLRSPVIRSLIAQLPKAKLKAMEPAAVEAANR